MTEKQSKSDFYLEQTTKYSMYVFAAATPFSIALTQISLTFALLCMLLRRFATKTIRFKSLRVEHGFLAFIIAEILALCFSTNFSQNFIFLKRLLLIPIVYLFAYNILDEKQLKKLLWIFVISVSIYSFTGIISYFLNPTLRVRHIQNSMTAGGITMFGSLVSVGLVLFLKEKKWRYLFLAFALINAVCLLLTSTRGSWLGFFAGLLFMIYFSNKKLFLVLPVLLVGFYFLGPSAFSDRVKNMFDPTWRTNAKRIFWWSVGIEIFKDNPVFGIGDVSTSNKFKEYAPPGTTEFAGHMHNNFIHIAVTLGMVGLAAFIYMITSIFVALFKNLTKIKIRGPSGAAVVIAISSFIAFNVNGLFEWNFGDAEIIMLAWFFIGMSLAVQFFENSTDNQTQTL